jgi:exonuclease III
MDPSKILFWNVRGLNSSIRQDAVRDLVGSSQVDVVCCQETKTQHFSSRDILSMLGAEFTEFVFLASVGFSGSILVAWKRNTGLQVILDYREWTITVSLSNSAVRKDNLGG